MAAEISTATEPGRADGRFLRACRREPVDATPVWFMRQAGRYMAEYRAIRKSHSLLEICRTPRLAAEVTLQPIGALGVDAAILFADILLLLDPLGGGLEFAEGDGPRLTRPVRSGADVGRLHEFDVPTELGFVAETIRLARRELGDVPLIGFAGGPFTVASYLVEGGHSRDFRRTKTLMYGEPEAWGELLGMIARLTRRYLEMQADAGAAAIQLFDSWVGVLSPEDYRRHVLPHSRSVLEPLAARGLPAIHFGTQTGSLLPDMKAAGATVVGLDWRVELGRAWAELGDDVAVQGNLDPIAFFAPWDDLRDRVRSILRQAGGRAGHVFNLGHGILPETSPERVADVVRLVHDETSGARAPS